MHVSDRSGRADNVLLHTGRPRTVALDHGRRYRGTSGYERHHEGSDNRRRRLLRSAVRGGRQRRQLALHASVQVAARRSHRRCRPEIISFVINGQLCDGGEQRQFGWGCFNAAVRRLGSGPMRAAKAVRHLRAYNRYTVTLGATLAANVLN
jgi:hypothetical protein